MLRSIRIKDFRSCRDVFVNLNESVVALVGKNGAGKTNLLRAIQHVADLCLGTAGPSTLPVSFSLSFSLGEHECEYEVTKRRGANRDELIVETMTQDGQLLFKREDAQIEAPQATIPLIPRVGRETSGLSALSQLLPEDDPFCGHLSRLSRYLRAIKYYSIPTAHPFRVRRTASIVEAGAYEQWKEELSKGRPDDSVPMRLLHMHQRERDKFAELMILLGSDGLRLIDEIAVERASFHGQPKPAESTDFPYLIRFRPCRGLAGAGKPYMIEGLSAGTMRVLDLLVYLVFDEASCMLLEQPEDSIHVGLLEKVIDILKTYSDRTQLICSTHSAYVMNLVGAAGIRLVTVHEGATAVSELSATQIANVTDYIRDEGTLAEFLETL
jgi:hypothetical protein